MVIGFACVTIAMLLAFPVGVQATTTPAPVSPSVEVHNDTANLSWLPPSISSAQLRIAGCASIRVAMTAIGANFSREYPSIQLNLSDGGNDAGFAKWIGGQIDIADTSRGIKPKRDPGSAS